MLRFSIPLLRKDKRSKAQHYKELNKARKQQQQHQQPQHQNQRDLFSNHPSSKPKPTTSLTTTPLPGDNAAIRQKSSNKAGASITRPWILVELRHGDFFRFPIPEELFRFSERRTRLFQRLINAHDNSSLQMFWRRSATPEFFVPLHLGDLVLCRVGNVFQTGIVHGGSLLSKRFFLPYSFHHDMKTVALTDRRAPFAEVSALVFPRTGGEILGLLRKSDLVAHQERALVTPPLERKSVHEQVVAEKNTTETSDDIWQQAVEEEHQKKQQQQQRLEPFGEGVPRLKSFTLSPSRNVKELEERVFYDFKNNKNEKENHIFSLKTKQQQVSSDDHHHHHESSQPDHPDVLVDKIYPALQKQSVFEQQLVAICRQELHKKEIRSIVVVAATSNISRDAAYFFYHETDVSTPLRDFKEHLAQVLNLETVWFTNVGAPNLFREMQQLKESSFVKVERDLRNNNNSNNNQHTTIKKEYIWPHHLTWPTPSRHIIQKSSNASSIALSHLLKCVLAKPYNFGIIPSKKQFSPSNSHDDINGGIWQNAVSLLHQTSFLRDIEKRHLVKSTSFSLCLSLCSLCDVLKKNDRKFISEVIAANKTNKKTGLMPKLQLSPRDAFGIFIAARMRKHRSDLITMMMTTTDSMLLQIDPQELFDFFHDEIINDVACEYTAIEARDNELVRREQDLNENDDYKEQQQALLTTRIPQNRFHQLADNVGLWKSNDIREDYSKVVEFMEHHHMELEHEKKMKVLRAQQELTMMSAKQKQTSENANAQKSNANPTTTTALVPTSRDQYSRHGDGGTHQNQLEKKAQNYEIAIDNLSEQRTREGLLVFHNLNRVIRQPYVVKYKGGDAVAIGEERRMKDLRSIVISDQNSSTSIGASNKVKDEIEAALLRKKMEEQSLMRRGIFEVGLELVCSVILSSSSSQTDSSSSAKKLLHLDEEKLRRIRKSYVANFHRELPPQSLIHWSKLVEFSCQQQEQELDKSSQSASSYPSSTYWKEAIKVLTKNIRSCSSSSSSHEQEMNKNQYIKQSISILDSCTASSKSSSTAVSPAVQRMRMVLSKLMSTNTTNDNDSTSQGGNNNNKIPTTTTSNNSNPSFELLIDSVIARSDDSGESDHRQQDRRREKIVAMHLVEVLRMLYKGL